MAAFVAAARDNRLVRRRYTVLLDYSHTAIASTTTLASLLVDLGVLRLGCTNDALPISGVVLQREHLVVGRSRHAIGTLMGPPGNGTVDSADAVLGTDAPG